MNLPCLDLFCRCCCCWLHSTRRSELKSVNTTWWSVIFLYGMETSLGIFWSLRNMKIKAINIDDRNFQCKILVHFHTICGIFFVNFVWFLAQCDIKTKIIFLCSNFCLIFWQSMHKLRKTETIFSWLQNWTTDACFNLAYISILL